jgi:hypothetical protein
MVCRDDAGRWCCIRGLMRYADGGHLPLRAVTPEKLEHLYAELLRCREHCPHNQRLGICVGRCTRRQCASCTTC